MMITVDTLISASIGDVWNKWIDPNSVKEWNHASDDWYCPEATNDLVVGGKFSYAMASTDNKNRFDFSGMYLRIETQKTIDITLDDGRKMLVEFEKVDDQNTIVTESFETESTNSVDLQRQGWQAILDNFKKYCEKV